MKRLEVDDWKGFTDLSWRMAFSLTPAGGKPPTVTISLHRLVAVVQKAESTPGCRLATISRRSPSATVQRFSSRWMASLLLPRSQRPRWNTWSTRLGCSFSSSRVARTATGLGTQADEAHPRVLDVRDD